MAEEWPAAAATDAATGAVDVNIDDYGETLSFLRCFDTMFLIDDSEHIAPFWSDVQSLLERIAPVCAKYDPDGIDVFFLNHRPKGLLSSMSFRKSGYRHLGGRAAAADGVSALFGRVKPGGKCNLGARLGKLLTWYCDKLKVDDEGAALNLIVITAGAFDDDVKKPLVHAAKMLDEMKVPEHQIGIQLFQIGQPTPEQKRNFEYLDDELCKEAHTRDIVDTTTWTGAPGSLSSDDLVKTILGAVVKSLDARKSKLGLDSSAPARRFDGDAF
ncbi:hypothetical protein BD289DRAFT_459830 [Coniella lustricola]|uniref:VWFA domain-containing protein n=1 Tax=Coniella lustricola TaxID=2025994 RepID=A0A2T3ACZ7_9PEZI|nr:hypothetical protein BD289DRAFT_459830 [Coniella lustricola]